MDDLYKQFISQAVSKRRNVTAAKMSDSEIIALSICSEVVGIDSEKAWYSFVKRNYRHLFSDLCCRTRFNRTRRNLLQVTELLRQKLPLVFPIPRAGILWLTVSHFPSANLGVHIFAVPSVWMGQTMENAHLKKKLILDSRFMPWSRWKDISRHLRLRRHPSMTGKGCVNTLMN